MRRMSEQHIDAHTFSMDLGIHIIEFKKGVFGFVGTLPVALGTVVPATTEDIMAGRAEVNPENGKAYTVKFPTFSTREAAMLHLRRIWS